MLMLPATSAQADDPPWIWLSGGIVSTIAFEDTDDTFKATRDPDQAKFAVTGSSKFAPEMTTVVETVPFDTLGDALRRAGHE